MSYEHRDTQHIEILSDKDATVAYVRLGNVEVTGSSRRTPGDVPDRETGELLALARAYAKLASKLEKRANGRVNHAAEIKRHKEERKTRRSTQFPEPDKQEFVHGAAYRSKVSGELFQYVDPSLDGRDGPEHFLTFGTNVPYRVSAADRDELERVDL